MRSETGKRYCTLMVFPGAHGRLRTIRIPLRAVQLFLALCAVGIFSLITLANTYARMLFRVNTYNNMRAERDILEKQNRNLEAMAQESDAKLGSLQSLAAEVSMSYGLGGSKRSSISPALLAATTDRDPVSGRDFFASVYTFKVLEGRGQAVVTDASSRNLLVDLVNGDSSRPSIWPVKGHITAGFGERMDPFTGEDAFHSGLDIAAPVGSPVRATADGILFHAGPYRGYGIEAWIDHGFGIATRYGHLSKVLVRVGEVVKRGQIIGMVGMTGRATGPHLHYEVIVHDSPVDPSRYIGRDRTLWASIPMHRLGSLGGR